MTEQIPEGLLPDGQVALYRFYAADGELLYVGITQQPEIRWKSHERDKIWWIDVARKEYVLLKSRSEAEELERKAIRVENPRYDRTRPGTFTHDGHIYKRPLDDPYQEDIVARVEQAMKADLASGVIPTWSLLHANAALSDQYKTSKAAIDHVLRRLHRDGLIAPTRSQYINAPREGFPSRAAQAHGPHYILAAHHFGLEEFGVNDLAPYVPYGTARLSLNLSRLCKQNLAQRVALRPSARYALTKMPDPDPIVVPPATWDDVAQMENWLRQQIEFDQRSTSNQDDLVRFQRDQAVVEACGRHSAEILAEMAYFYAGRAGYQEAWKPERLGGATKPAY